MTTYEDFLASKRVVVPDVGLKRIPQLNAALFPFQREAVRWALRRGRAALFEDCGLGKSLQSLEWSRVIAAHTKSKVLILAPLAVAGQTVREGEKFSITVRYAREQREATTPVTITNYEMLDRFDPSAFAGIVLDECFAAGTLIDLVGLDGEIDQVPIEDVRVGDRIANAVGVDIVADVHRREVPYAVAVTINGSEVLCSPNHPWLTRRGWRAAQDLEPGDACVATTAAMRLVREGLRAETRPAGEAALLQSVLLSEVANAAAGGPRGGAFARGGGEAGPCSLEVAGLRRSSRGCGDRKGARARSSGPDARAAREDLPPIARDEARSFRAWGQRSWFDGAAADSSGCSRFELAGGIELVVGPTDSGLSHALQARLGAARAASLHRSGWCLPSLEEGPRREENGEARFARVDGLEVLEPGDPRLA